MDNLSHSVAGLALGELVERSLPAESDPAHARLRRRLLLVSGWAASNFPDLDLVLTPLAPEPLGYLLHHRGHTHTLLYLLPQALLLFALLWLLWPGARGLLRVSRAARRGFALAAGLGLLLHLGMDSLNVYGVHLFHPFAPGWQYGDLVFIVEPVFWVGLGVPLAALVAARAWRWLLYALLAGAPVAFTLLGFLQWGSLALLALLGLGLAWVQARLAAGAGLAAGFAAIAAFIGVQALAADAARDRVARALAHTSAAARLLDVPLTAFPTNPLCWSFIAISSDAAAGTYRLRRGVLSLAPELNPIAACPARFGGKPGAGDPALVFDWEERGSLAVLRVLRQADCRIDAWLRFARAPSLAGGVATDIRFGALGRDNFTRLAYGKPSSEPCPYPIPRWGYPRADLLGGHRDG